ncbi:hypothetical protein NHX12_013089 [Muraenolepis orangiensis]|uniref:Uncharacterized protein n=1 Tax=Muraenolepis orangiensis TaxID=630683 RepID=A0A9Q0I6J1_9TELE|nr:hypothetical protein NHX12_013089 [Muraenolepis orangiensis]
MARTSFRDPKAPYPSHPSPSLLIPPYPSHPSPSLLIPPYPSHPSPSLLIPPYPSLSLPIPPYPSLSLPSLSIPPYPSLSLPIPLRPKGCPTLSRFLGKHSKPHGRSASPDCDQSLPPAASSCQPSGSWPAGCLRGGETEHVALSPRLVLFGGEASSSLSGR